MILHRIDKQLILNALIIIFSLPQINAQDLDGKWSMIVLENTISIPPTIIYEIKRDKLITYSFDRVYSIDSISINYQKKEMIVDSMKRDIIFVDDFKVKFSTIDQNNNKGYQEFVKLIPTKINYPLDSIRKKEFEGFQFFTFMYNNKKIQFKDSICQDYFNYNSKKKCNKFSLEKIDNTYFIVYYLGNTRYSLTPIKEINQDHLLVYGIAGKEGFVKLHEIKEIERTKSFFPDNN